MPTEFFTTSSFGTGIRYDRSANDTNVVVNSGVLLGSSNDDAIALRGIFHDLLVRGTVVGYGNGITLGSAGANRNTLHVASDGLVQGQLNGAAFYGTGRVANDGTILGNDYGVTFSTAGAIYDVSVVNRGLIQGGKDGVWIANGDRIARLVNDGTIEGAEHSYRGGFNPDVVVNRAVLRGDVRLGGSEDRYDGREGRVEDREIYGGDGQDTFLPGMGEEIIDGGDGYDTIDLRGSAGVRMSLVDETGSGRAADDSYFNAELFLGSRHGADTLIGNGQANTFEGFGGADVLSGGGGADWLEGGLGADRLSGGAGHDRFRFHQPADRGDVIADWGSSTVNNDVIEIAAMNFGVESTSTLAASRFRSRADNLAQDADDRFMFRTTDATLWWDADGTGAAAPPLVADLQAGAVLTASDFVVV